MLSSLLLRFLNNTEDDSVSRIQLLGLKPGSTKLRITLLNPNCTEITPLYEDYTVYVVQRVDVVEDAFMYVLCSAQMLVLLMLGWRLRSGAVRQVLCRPGALITAIICQAVLMPVVWTDF